MSILLHSILLMDWIELKNIYILWDCRLLWIWHYITLYTVIHNFWKSFIHAFICYYVAEVDITLLYIQLYIISIYIYMFYSCIYLIFYFWIWYYITVYMVIHHFYTYFLFMHLFVLYSDTLLSLYKNIVAVWDGHTLIRFFYV